jgi:hypothetical protein
MFDYLRTDDAMLDALCIVAMSRSIVFCIVCIDNTLAIQNSTPMISGAAIAVGYRLRREVDPSESRLNRDACNVIAAQPRARRLVEIVRFNAQDAREFSDPLARDAIASVFIAADLPRRYVGGLGKLAHCHPAMPTVFLQALSDVCVDGALAIHRDHPPNAKKSACNTPKSAVHAISFCLKFMITPRIGSRRDPA